MRKVVAVVLAALMLPGVARAETDALVRQALALHGRGDAEAAYRLLIAQEPARAGDPDFDYALGIAAADSNHRGVAIAALQRVIAVQPDNVQARAEIARVYAMAGDLDTARAAFQTVLDDPTTPDPVRRRLDGVVRRYGDEIGGGARQVTGFVEGEAGYDSNINSATSLGSITIPLFAFLGPATLGGGSSRVEDGFGGAQAGISASTGVGRGDRVYGSALGLWRDAFDRNAFDQAALTGTAGYVHGFANRDALSLSGQVQRFWYGREGLRTSYGAIGQYTRALARAGATLSGQVQYYRFDYDAGRGLDADRVGATITYADERIFAVAGGGREDTDDATAGHLDQWYGAVQAGGEFPVARNVALVVSANAERRVYDDPDPLFLRARRDTQLDVSLGVGIGLTRALSVRPRATYTRNFSNIALYDFERVVASTVLRVEF